MDKTDEQPEQYATAVNEYLRRSYEGTKRDRVLASGGWDAEFAAELAELGWFGLAVPEAHGGLGVPLSTLGPIFMELGERLVAGPSLENVLLPALLQRPGDWESAPAIAAVVETGVPMALVDPGVTDDWRRDVGSIMLADGVLHGEVNLVRFAQQASLLAVIADSAAGPVMCLVDPAGAGVVTEAVASSDPTATMGRVVLDGASPLDSRTDGQDDSALILRSRAWARLLIACELSGITRRVLDRTVEYIKEREQFGRAIGSFQAVKHIAASMHSRTAGLHSVCLAAIDDADGADLRHLETLAAATKAHAADAALRVCEDALQLQGGMGFTTENELNLYYKRALALRAWYGDETELALRVGTALLEPAPVETAPFEAAPL